MARSKLAMPSRTAILALADADGRLEVRVSPGASADVIALPASGGSLAVRTTAPPEDGKANDAVPTAARQGARSTRIYAGGGARRHQPKQADPAGTLTQFPTFGLTQRFPETGRLFILV